MVTKYNSGDKIWVMATVRKAEQVKDKIYYTIDESEYIVPEDIVKKCTEEEISALKEAKRDYQCAVYEENSISTTGYSSQENLFQPT